ncbi:hypothetical protein F5Y05DRAFT_423385 [Hypoxylon sp. FL0543]|nr:hypothetical protein F5Y05DRAFT_423385 [Hypoxylon sp. FL0543]
MCKRTLVHRMHHDVRAPLIIDLYSDTPTVYANPRHTRYHQCELSRPPPLGKWLLNSPHLSCEYHSCCLLEMEVEFCADFSAKLALFGGADDSDDEFEPEECEYFTIEHRHVRFEYFGQPDAYYNLSVPSTWREDIRDLPADWFSGFKREKSMVSRWEEEILLQCEALHMLENDAKTHFLVYCDLIEIWPPRSPHLLSAESNLEKTQKQLIQRKEYISSLVSWARGGPSQPMSAFTPIWWRRMQNATRPIQQEGKSNVVPQETMNLTEGRTPPYIW